MPTNQTIDLSALAAVLNITNVAALSTGFDDGKEQGFELSTGMSYDDEHSQWAYDVGTWIGACVAVRPDNTEPDNRRVISARDLADEAKGIIRFG